MLNFTVGPVKSYEETLQTAGEQLPYFRTAEFSNLMMENESLLLKCLNAPLGSKCAFLTTSGTGGMEASVVGLLSCKDKVGVINGGSFGRRFVELCILHSIDYVEIKCEFGKPVTRGKLDELEKEGLTALLVNMDETSSGVLYDMSMISEFCKAKSLFLIVDAISSFLADPLDMKGIGANAVIIASQKALALQPGLSVVAMDEYALRRVYQNKDKTMYLSLKDALENMRRGQTPFTPAVSVLLQLNVRLRMIQENGGVSYEINRVKELAHFFRNKINDYPLKMLVAEEKNRSNAVTAIVTDKHNATEICEVLKDRFAIWVCPNGGEYRDRVFRVGHIGAIDCDDYKTLFDALDTLSSEGIL